MHPHSSTALTPDECGHAVVKVRQFEESQAGTVGVLQPTSIVRSSRSRQCALLFTLSWIAAPRTCQERTARNRREKGRDCASSIPPPLRVPRQSQSSACVGLCTQEGSSLCMHIFKEFLLMNEDRSNTLSTETSHEAFVLHDASVRPLGLLPGELPGVQLQRSNRGTPFAAMPAASK